MIKYKGRYISEKHPTNPIEPATINLITNPSFEVNTAGWTSLRATITRIITDYKIGIASLSIVATNTFAFASIDMTAPTAGVYAVSWRQKRGTQTPTDCLVQITEAIVGDTILENTFTPEAVWTYKFGFVTVVNASATLTLSFYARTGGGVLGDELLIDGIQVEKQNAPTSYCDGSLGDGYKWSGTAHASTSSRVE